VDVVVIGAGISGLLSAYWLSRNKHVSSLIVFEKRPLNAIPRKHCSGVISRDTMLRIPYAVKFIENSYNRLKVYVAENLEVELIFDKNAIYKIDRVAHEKLLLEVVKERGVEIMLNTNVVDVEKVKNKYRVRGFNVRGGEFDQVIVAEGYPPNLSRKLNLESRFNTFKGIQQEAYLSRKLDCDSVEVLYVYIGRNTKGFAWLIPVNERRLIVGVASKDNVFGELSLVKRFFEKKLNIEMTKMKDLYGGIVLRGYPKKLLRGSILGIGDAVAMVKSLSGGGLYPISVTSTVYGENLHKPEVLNRKTKSIARELMKQYKLYELITRGLKLPRSILLFSNITAYIGDSYFYDHHEKILAKAFTTIKFG